MCLHFLGRLTLVSVSNGVGFFVRDKVVRCNATLKQYLNASMEMGMTKGLLN